ncbi:unnamed protein product [Calypogeia fissa]
MGFQDTQEDVSPRERVSPKDEEIVLLVVGDNTESKSRVADMIVAHEGSGKLETTKAGVRIFTITSHKIIDTRVFPTAVEGSVQEDSDRHQIARRWISRNSLRRLLVGKLLSVVCVLTSSVDCEISEEAYKKKFAWLDILGVMFQEHRQAIRIVVDTRKIGKDQLPVATEHIKVCLNQHGFIDPIYLNLRGGKAIGSRLVVKHRLFHQNNLVKSFRGDNMYNNPDGSGLSEELEIVQTGAFFMEEPAIPQNPTSLTNTPWGPERVILFGRTGSGKSTLAQMLTTGKLEPNSERFKSSSGIRGETKQVSYGHGRGWYVVDTPGFGEPKSGESTVPTQVAEDRIKKFVKTIDGLYTHFLFVVKKDRIDELEVRLWNFFVCLFGSDINDHFSIVISNADEEWVNRNITHLSEIFKGCRSFLCAEFPSAHTGDAEWEHELEKIRQESLERMENDLADLSRKDVVCQFGGLSKTALMTRRGIQGNGLQNACQNAAILVMKVCTSSLTDTLKVDQNIALLPA